MARRDSECGERVLVLWFVPRTGLECAMPDRSEDLRREAARCREAAEHSTDPSSRDKLIRLADKFLELAKSAKADFDPVLEAVTHMAKEASELIVQQQQVQPPKKEE
jgi:hypothetical protein